MDHVPWPVIPSRGGGIAEWRATLAHGIEQSGLYFAKQAWCPWPVIAGVQTVTVVLASTSYQGFVGLAVLRLTNPARETLHIFWPFAIEEVGYIDGPEDFTDSRDEYYLTTDKLTNQYIAFGLSYPEDKRHLLVYDATMKVGFDRQLLALLCGTYYDTEYMNIHIEPPNQLLSWPHHYLCLGPEVRWIDHSTCTDGSQTLRLYRTHSELLSHTYVPTEMPDLRAYLMLRVLGPRILMATLHDHNT